MASTQTPAQKPAEQAQAPAQDKKATPALEEDDEFEDFPVEGTQSVPCCCCYIFGGVVSGIFGLEAQQEEDAVLWTSPRGVPRGALRCLCCLDSPSISS